MFNKEIKSVIDLLQAFPDEQSCIEHFERIRWDGNVVSPFDASSKVYKTKNGYMCKNTQKNFNVKTNTLFDNTKMPLQKWFLAIFIATSHKKGISSLQLSRDLDITQKSAWFMLQRIRNCFKIDSEIQLRNEVECDETYVGGKDKNRPVHKRSSANYFGKDIVFGAVERGGKVYAKTVNHATSIELQEQVLKSVEIGSVLYSDEHRSYRALGKVYDHQYIKHNKNEYVRGNIHTNTIEGFWSLLKRGIIGIYHFTSKKHLQLYVDEFVYRYNTRDLSTEDRINLLLSNGENRTTYKMLIH
ncbi:IS1595 family transposase [Flavobacterium sp. N1994]|uniref:IS1595 family transposase n=1 Tax=Flavobacterium sp. N1994 TaxID=2986827 RepID=UPI0022238650|nr:IS1595 family transposase [Flavobacterium sp. N1994]